jgi:branched-subunit amino acid transport protein AzlD
MVYLSIYLIKSQARNLFLSFFRPTALYLSLILCEMQLGAAAAILG